MTTMASNAWYEANQRYLSAAMTAVRERLGSYRARLEGTSSPDEEGDQEAQRALQAAWAAMPAPSALETLCTIFGLSSFERDILLLCAGMEFDPSFASLCAMAQANPARSYPTFSLAMAALPNPHWSALLPSAPLRHWRLIEVEEEGTLTLSPLRIDERVLHYLAGLQHLDQRLVGIIEPLHTSGELVPSHQFVVEQVAAAWSRIADGAKAPVIQLCGDEIIGKRIIATTVCDRLGLHLCMISTQALPSALGELDSLMRLWERESALRTSALLVDCEEIDSSDAPRMSLISRFIEHVGSMLIVTSRDRLRVGQFPLLTFEVRKPTLGEQRIAWQQALGNAAPHLNGQMEKLLSQFSLSTKTIQSASAEALARLQLTRDDTQKAPPLQELSNTLWEICRVQGRPRLDDLAQRIEPAAGWDDLVLPELQRQILRDIAAHIRQRSTVYEEWGFTSKGARGLGISALFSGASGTGKTMAAEVLASELQLDLYRIDLSQVVSKYIGETEKNLRRVFDAAEEGGVILLFDEADSLFGKRSEVKDSHDRYANIEVSYLLQRMEAYRGLAILTTNIKSALDTAFLRRIRFIVQFPFPGSAQRAEIWRRVFPSSTPTEKLDVMRLAQLNVVGGNIRNIALNAAFLAAEAGTPVRMGHILEAARSEYAKLERLLTPNEIGGWV